MDLLRIVSWHVVTSRLIDVHPDEQSISQVYTGEVTAEPVQFTDHLQRDMAGNIFCLLIVIG